MNTVPRGSTLKPLQTANCVPSKLWRPQILCTSSAEAEITRQPQLNWTLVCVQSETEQKKNITGPIVLTLLVISVVVPMLQYYGYTSEE